MKAVINWIDGNKLKGFTDNGKIVLMDSGEHSESASPAQLILQSLAGCTMMDCVLILTKARKHINKFWVEVEAEEASEHPKIFRKIHLTYIFEGLDLHAPEIERAIRLSEEKYCRVNAMLKGTVKITSSYKIFEPVEI